MVWIYDLWVFSFQSFNRFIYRFIIRIKDETHISVVWIISHWHNRISFYSDNVLLPCIVQTCAISVVLSITWWWQCFERFLISFKTFLKSKLGSLLNDWSIKLLDRFIVWHWNILILFIMDNLLKTNLTIIISQFFWS